MNERSRTFDVVVVGGGLSGMVAALAARRRGARVALLADGCGTLEMASGCIDLLGVSFDPWAGLVLREPPHPYALLGREQIDAGLTAFLDGSRQAGLTYRLPAGRTNQMVMTALGTLRPTYLAPATAAVPRPGEPVWVAGFEGLPEFHPGVAAAGLRRALPDTPVVWSSVDLPLPPGKLVALARLLEQPRFRRDVLRALVAARPSVCRHVFLPAVLGLFPATAALIQAEFADALDAEVGEVILPPPSLPGLRLADGWRRLLQQEQVELVLGVRAVGARTAGGRAEAVRVDTPAGFAEYRAGAFVLAGGGLLGTGLEADGLTLREPVFGLPVTAPDPGDVRAWADPQMLPATGHGFVRAGVPTDADLRPAALRNLFVCGRMLAGYDPYLEGSGGGVAVATGWKAGLMAGGATA